MPRDLSDGAIQTDRFDRRKWGDVRESSERIHEAEQTDNGGLLQSVWASLYKASPQINEEAPLFDRRVMQTIMNQHAWKELRQATQLDEFSSALGSLSLYDQFDSILPQDLQKQASEMRELAKQAQTLLDQANLYDEALEGSDDQSQEDYRPKAEQLRQDAQTFLDQLDASTQALNQEFDDQASQLGKALRNALEGAVQEAQENAEIAEAWGFGPGSGQPVSGRERMELAQLIQKTPRLRDLAKMVGRMQSIALNKRRNRTNHPPTEIVNVTVGNDLARILPSELMLLADPRTKADFLLRFAENRLLQYDLKGFEREGQGPIVVCMDESGSTAGIAEMWEKSVALSLFAIARREKRAFAIVHFGSESECEVRKWERPHRDGKPVDLIEMAQHFFNGGTNFERPLNEAVSILEDSVFEKGDIVFLTDGEAQVSPEFLERFRRVKREKAFNVISIVIGYADDAVRVFSDQVIKVQGISSSDDALLTFVVESLN